MRPIHWYSAIFVLLFVSLALFVLRARTAQAPSPVLTPVASVGQIMNGLTVPASDAIFRAVATVMSSDGIRQTAPKDPQEWQAVENSAAVLVESGNLLMIARLTRDHEDWIEMTQAFMEAGKAAMKAAHDKDAEALRSSFDELSLTCERCHLRYLK
jgi:hypothetical protein